MDPQCESSFTEVAIPLSLPRCPMSFHPRELPCGGPEVHQMLTDSNDETTLAQGSNLSTETTRIEGDTCVSQAQALPSKFTTDDDVGLDSLWNELCETIVTESDKRSLRDSGETGEDDCDFVEVTEDLTLSEDEISTGLNDEEPFHSIPEADNRKKASNNEQQMLYSGA